MIGHPPLLRSVVDVTARYVAVLVTLVTVGLLGWILFTTVAFGISALNLRLFTRMTPPPGADGGLLNALFGTFSMSVAAMIIAIPLGIAAGTYLAEYATLPLVASAIRIGNDVLLSAPSIIIGLFIYEVVVRAMGHFSAIAGSLSLALIALPVIVRSADEMLGLLPNTLREAAFALGIPQSSVIRRILYRAAWPGIVTGSLLALARICGETAPLLFTALNNQYWSTNPNEPIANVPVVIFQYAMSPFESWHALAWAGALLITLLVLVFSVVSRRAAIRSNVIDG